MRLDSSCSEEVADVLFVFVFFFVLHHFLKARRIDSLKVSSSSFHQGIFRLVVSAGRRLAILEDRAQSRTAVARDEACASIQHVDSSSVTVRLVFSDIFARNTFLSMDARGGTRRIEDRFLEKEGTGTEKEIKGWSERDGVSRKRQL